MPVRLGELLVSRGLLTNEQVDQILERQQHRSRPFGLLAEQMFGVAEEDIEQVWAEQYEAITGTIDVVSTPLDGSARELVSRRQAWQFQVLPIRFDGTELVLATTRKNLPRALRFALRVLETPAYFVLADAEDLGRALERNFPLAGMDASSIAA